MLAVLLLAACASSPGNVTNESEIVRVDLDGEIRPWSRRRGNEAFIASDLRVGVDGDLIRYKASYSIEPGDFLAAGAGATTNTRFGGQRFGQNLDLQLPELAGAPLSVALATEFGDNWQLSGYSQFQSERANVNWSPGPATVDVDWAGNGTPFDATSALTCGVQSTLSVPTHTGTNHSEGVRISAAGCNVVADETVFAGLDTRTFGLGYFWSRPQRESEARISVVEPALGRLQEYRLVEPGYKFGLSHRRDFGPLSARAILSYRQSPVWIGSAAPVLGLTDVAASNWATSTSLTWEMPAVSLSANWATGVDRLWFTPDLGGRSDRFGLALNLSRWLGTLANGSAPRLAMNWEWSEMRLPGDEVSGNNSLSLDMALMF